MRHSFSLAALASACISGISSAALAELSGVTATSNGWDATTCAPNGCVADNVLDDSIEPESRWSCTASNSDIEVCELTLVLDEPQDIFEVRMAMFKGNERTRIVNIFVDGFLSSTLQTSGTTLEYEPYLVVAKQATTIVIQEAGLDVWISMTGVKIMTDTEIDVSSPSPAPDSDDYVGCFSDKVGDRVLTTVMTNDALTPADCAATCGEMSKYFYGLQQGNECWCAGCDITERDTNSGYDRHGDDNCTTPCAGDSTSACGGDLAISLYQTATCLATPAPTPAVPTSALSDLDLPENIASAIIADAVGGWAGPGYPELDDGNEFYKLFITGGAELGTVTVSGKFERDDAAALPASTALYLYIHNEESESDFVRGQGVINSTTGDFTATITDFAVGYSRGILSFVVLDPTDALDDSPDDTVFTMDVMNEGCSDSLRVKLEWDSNDDLDLWVTDPNGDRVSYNNKTTDIGYVNDRNGGGWTAGNPDTGFTSSFEEYVVFSGLSGDAMLGEYRIFARRDYAPSANAWTLTATIDGAVVWVEEGVLDGSSTTVRSANDDSVAPMDDGLRRLSTDDFSSSYTSYSSSWRPQTDVFTITLGSYNDVGC